MILLVYILLLSISGYNNYSDNLLRVYYLDIGQGDSVLIKTPDNKTVLIDGGPDNTVLYEIGEVLPYWIDKIDMVILTHPDLDHLGGLIEITDRYDVDTYMFNDVSSKSSYFRYFKKVLSESESNIVAVHRGENIQIGQNVTLEVLWPTSDYFLTNDDVNDGSVTVILEYGEFSMYLGGDLSSEYELMSISGLKYDIDVLKLGHHGSKYSTSDKLLKDLSPEVAVISAGEDNNFGHPNQEVIDLLNNNSIKFLRTDIQGRIEVTSDGKDYWIEVEK